jgi:methyl-accepting chemotaxis protein
MNTIVFAAVVAVSALVTAPREKGEPREPREARALPGEVLTAQEKEVLGLARELAQAASTLMDRWVSAKETTDDRLFSFLYFPIPNTDPPKYTTPWDKLADRDFSRLSDGIMARSPTIEFAVIVDKNGYLPTHNEKYSKPLTGNPAVDLVANRTKRIFNDRTGLTSARSTANHILQRYQRDTGETLGEIAVPIFVHGQHWGAARIGYRVLEAASTAQR